MQSSIEILYNCYKNNDEFELPYSKVIEQGFSNSDNDYTTIDAIDYGFIRLISGNSQFDIFPASLIEFCNMVVVEWTALKENGTIFVFCADQVNNLVRRHDDKCYLYEIGSHKEPDWKSIAIYQFKEFYSFIINDQYWEAHHPEIALEMPWQDLLQCMEKVARDFAIATHKQMKEIVNNRMNYIDEGYKKTLASLQKLHAHFGL